MFPPTDIVVSNDVSLQFDLPEHGWASLKLAIGSETVSINGFGDLTNALHDVAFAALSAATAGGSGFHRFSMDGEPEEWRWTINSLHRSERGFFSHVRIEWFREDNPHVIDEHGNYARARPDSPGEILFDAWCDSDQFAKAIREAYRPLEAAGPDYVEKAFGMYPFPTRTLAALDVALATPRRPVPARDDDLSAVLAVYSTTGKK